MAFSFLPTSPQGSPGRTADGVDPQWVDAIEQRVMDRVDAWMAVELDDRVIRIVERRLQEETERRAWRSGTEVF